jgi:hypothetical protein
MVRWVIDNAFRFALVWLVAATVFVVALDPSGAPVALLVAMVALVLFAPVLAVWLALYLAVAWGVARAVPRSAAPLTPIVIAPLLWLFLADVDPPEVRWTAIAAVVVFGLVAKPPPRRSGGLNRSKG